MTANDKQDQLFREVRRLQYRSSHEAWKYILCRRPDYIRYYLPRVRSLDTSRSPLADRQPWLTYPALRWLSNFLKPHMRVFEWGMGGSTLFFAERVAHVISVEHDREWFTQISKVVSSEQFHNSSCHLVEPDPRTSTADLDAISQAGEWAGRSFLEYSETIESFADQSFDLVLVDGRARVACLKRALGKVRGGGAIMLDNSEYERYGPAIRSFNETLSGWKRLDLWGPLAYSPAHISCSTIWFNTADR